jgi:hypothetical protein
VVKAKGRGKNPAARVRRWLKSEEADERYRFQSSGYPTSSQERFLGYRDQLEEESSTTSGSREIRDSGRAGKRRKGILER